MLTAGLSRREIEPCFCLEGDQILRIQNRDSIHNASPGQHQVIIGMPLWDKLARFPSDRRRIAYLAEATAGCTGLTDFPRYLTLLFEVDALFSNDGRHLNNIAVLQENGAYSYCPIFDNGAGLLSNTQLATPPAAFSDRSSGCRC